MKRVYVAGLYSRNKDGEMANVIEVLDNMRIGMRVATEVFLVGYAPFCPWLDYHFTLMLREGEKLEIEDYYKYSLAWVEVSDALLLLSGWENSPGTKNEVRRAKKLRIPICKNLEELQKKVPWMD